MDETTNLAPKPGKAANVAPTPKETAIATPNPDQTAMTAPPIAEEVVAATAPKQPPMGQPPSSTPPKTESASDGVQRRGGNAAQMLLGFFIIGLTSLNVLVLLILPIVFHRRLTAAAFYGYLTVAASAALVLLVIAFLPYSLTDYLFWVRAQVKATGFWGRLRWLWGFAVLSPIVNGLNWPGFLIVVVISQLKVRQTVHGGGRQREMATYVKALCEPVYAIVSLVEIGICFALVDVQPRGLGYGRALVAVFCVGILLRLLQYLQIEGGLLANLRAVPGMPAVRFVIILAANYLALVLGIAAYTEWAKQPHVPVEMVKKIAISLTSLTDVKNRLVPGPLSVKLHALGAMSLSDWLLTVSTLLFYFVLLRSVLRIKDFARKDQDYVSLAYILTTRGQYREALQELQKIQSPNAASESMKIAPNLALGNIDRAFKLTERWLQSKNETERVSPEDIFNVLVSIGFTSYSLPTAMMVKMFEEAQKVKCQDSGLAASMLGVTMQGQFTTAECRAAFPPGTEVGYPLTHAGIFIVEGNKPDAMAMLSRSVSTTPADQVMKLTYDFMWGLQPKVEAGADPGAVAREWLEANFEHYRMQCDACVEDWNEELVLGLVSPVCGMGSELAPMPEFFEELRKSVEERIRSKAGGAERQTFLDEVLQGAQRYFGS